MYNIQFSNPLTIKITLFVQKIYVDATWSQHTCLDELAWSFMVFCCESGVLGVTVAPQPQIQGQFFTPPVT